MVHKILHAAASVRGGSKAAATSKRKHFVIIVNGWKPLTIIPKHSILGVAAGLDPPLSAKQTYPEDDPDPSAMETFLSLVS